MKKIILLVGIGIGGTFCIFLFASAKTEILLATRSGFSGIHSVENFGKSREISSSSNSIFAVESLSISRPVRDSGFFGVSTTEFLGLQVPDFSTHFALEFDLLKKAENILTLDALTEISNGDREGKLTALENDIEEIKTQLQQSREQTLAKKTYFDEESQRWKAAYSVSEKEYADHFAAKNSELAAKKLEDTIAQKQNYIFANENSKTASALLDRIAKGINLLENRQTAIEKNRDALLAGITVDAKTARSIGLVRD